ncbi:MAG: hypothetical protein GY949_23450 [Gammaproteobacteria bacterium]|nr:hypothetical protein [Gammaproteobacteria bacterium]
MAAGSDTKLILHFGMHKTGSSSIQESLAAHLNDPDFAYLNLGQPNGSHTIQQAFDPRIAKAGSLPDAAFEGVRRTAKRRIGSCLKALRAPTGIISAETLVSLPGHGFKGFVGLLHKKTRNIRAVGYVRAPKAYAESAFQQRLKRGHVPLDPGSFRLRYHSKFEKFDRILGRENVNFWKFDPKMFHQGDVVLDFCARLGIAFDPEQVIRVNDGLSAPAVQLLYIYRLYQPQNAPDDLRIVEALSALEGAKLRFHSELMRDLVAIEPGELDGIEARIGANLDEDWAAHDAAAFRSETDFLALDPGTLDWLAAEAQQRVSALRDNPEAVAKAVAVLGRPAVLTGLKKAWQRRRW